MFFSKKSSGILGMNARNLLYISKYNSLASKKFADDKIFTKHFLESRGIGVAKLYHVIKSHQQLTSDFFDILPNQFVVKPNRGFAGGGIIVIKERKKNYWITASGKRIDDEQLFRNCIDILEGKYSISGVHDQIIFEEKLDPHPDFRSLTEVGLPDVRVIAFNMVPTIAMLRVPTNESDGKANMELGAIAMGIDIGSGKTTGAAYYSNYIKRMPNGQSAVGFQIPYWNDILHAVAKIQSVTKIGFLGVDLVITKTGLKVLEINARAGLKVQIANRVPLRARLEKISDIKVVTPEDGVEVAKTLFSTTSSVIREESKPEKPIIGIMEPVILYGDKPQNLYAQIDLLAEENSISEKYFDASVMDLSIAGKRLKLPVEKGKNKGSDIILAGKYMGDFLIDPNKKIGASSMLLTANLDEKVIKNIDKKICEIDSRIKLLSNINPKNLAEQKTIFLAHPDYSPRFFYRESTIDFDQIRTDLKKIPRNVNHFLFPLYANKIESIENKLHLLESTDSKDFGVFSKKLFGPITQNIYKSALRFLRDQSGNLKPDESPELETKQAIEVLNNFLNVNKLTHWEIKILEDSVSDIQVTKRNSILLKKGATFKKNRLKALLVHEIGTHVFRFENGKNQPFEILERGTANYLHTEEGLAVWNQNQLALNLGDKFLKPAYHIIAIYMAERMSFRDLFHYLKTTHNLEDELAWDLCVKSKRGLKSTDLRTAFTKGSIYFTGERAVKKFLKQGGKIEDLYVGKIDIEDLPLIQKIEGLKKAKFLP